MKTTSKHLITGLAVLVLPLSSQAADVIWSTPANVTNNTDIQSAGITNLAGANFGLTTGTTTTVNNGSVDVEFKSMNSNQSVGLSNGVTVSASGYGFDVACSAPAGVTGNYRTVMTRHMGVGGGVNTINLTGLTIGTEYQIQAYITGSDPNTSTISGSPSLVAGGGNNPGNNNGFGQWIVGTFTADALSQALTHTANTTEPVINALTIGTVDGGPDTTPPDWTATWPQVDPLSSTSLIVRAKTNEDGTAYYVVLPDGATPPSAAQVKALTDSANTPVSASGSLALTANTEATAPVTGLTAATTYDVYFVAEDAVANLQASPSLVSVSTGSEPATVTWDSVTTPVDESSIVGTGVTGIVGANFANSAVSPLVANGVTFTAVTQNSSANIGGGITVATSGMDYTNLNSAISNVTGTFGSVVMDSHTGLLAGQVPSPCRVSSMARSIGFNSSLRPTTRMPFRIKPSRAEQIPARLLVLMLLVPARPSWGLSPPAGRLRCLPSRMMRLPPTRSPSVSSPSPPPPCSAVSGCSACCAAAGTEVSLRT